MMGMAAMEARRAFEALMAVAAARGMPMPVRRAVAAGGWLVVELDPARLPDLAEYLREATLHHLRAALGRPVYAVNRRGLWYAIPLQGRPRLPAAVAFPGPRPGVARLGVGPRGEVALRWEEFGHMLVAGLTRSGKSAFLRLIAVQALAQGFEAVVLDPRGLLLAELSGPRIERPPAEAFPEVLEVLEAWMRERDAALRAAGAEDLAALNRIRTERGEAPLPRRLVVVDELEAFLALHPGLGRRLALLLWQGAKDGLHIVAAVHEPTRAELGPLRDAFSRRVAFRLLTASASRAFLGTPGAERIRRPGRALSPELGPFQAYHLPAAAAAAMAAAPEGRLAPEEAAALARAVGPDGRVTLRRLMEAGVPERQARRLLEELRERGVLVKDPAAHNAHRLSPEAAAWLRAAAGGGEGSSPGAEPAPIRPPTPAPAPAAG